MRKRGLDVNVKWEKAVKFPPDASEIYYVTWMVKRRTWTIQIYVNIFFLFSSEAKHPVLESF